MNDFDITVIGGGLAGLTAALHAQSMGYKVCVLEKGDYPRHKVCGEYLSTESVEFLSDLGIHLPTLGAVSVNELELTKPGSHSARAKLSQGGLGISRYRLEEKMATLFESRGGNLQTKSEVLEVLNIGEGHILRMKDHFNFKSRVVIGAYGKRSSIKKGAWRRTPFFAVKNHYEAPSFDNNKVQLNFFKGGYGGLSAVENGRVNFCYMGRSEDLKKSGSLTAYEKDILKTNRTLAWFLEESSPVLNKPLAISQIDFGNKKRVEDGVLLIGDSAGMIFPLSGNGMSIAIHSALLACLCSHKYLSGQWSKKELEAGYDKEWRSAFFWRIQTSRLYQRVVTTEWGQNMSIQIMKVKPLAEWIVSSTHGTPTNYQWAHAG